MNTKNLFDTPADESLFAGSDDSMRRVRQAIRMCLKTHLFELPVEVQASLRWAQYTIDRSLGDGAPCVQHSPSTREMLLNNVVHAETKRHLPNEFFTGK